MYHLHDKAPYSYNLESRMPFFSITSQQRIRALRFPSCSDIVKTNQREWVPSSLSYVSDTMEDGTFHTIASDKCMPC